MHKGEKMEKSADNYVRLTLAAKEENVAVARLAAAAIAGELGFTFNEVEEIKVAVSEGISNAIIHGYQNEKECLVEMTMVVRDDELMIKIRDEGIGIADIEKAMQPTYTSVADRMGLGFVFMQSFMDSLEVISKPEQGTTLVMKKKAAGG